MHLWESFQRALAGLFIGGAIGFAFGLLNGLVGPANRLFDSSLQMLRNIPHLAMIPLVILWFGIGEPAKLFLIVIGVFFPIYVNTIHGIRSTDPKLIEMGRIYGLSSVGIAPHGGIAQCTAIDFGRASLCARDYVADVDRG